MAKKIYCLAEMAYQFDLQTDLKGGGERVFQDMITLLKNIGYEVKCFQFSHEKRTVKFRGHKIQGIGNIPRNNPINGYINGINYFQEIAEKEADGIYLLSMNLAHYTAKIPTITTSHGIMYNHCERADHLKPVENLDSFKRWIRNTTFTVSCDTDTLHMMSVYCPQVINKMAYIPNYVDLSIFKPKVKKDDGIFRILYPRRLQHCRGYHILMESAENLLKKYENIEIIFAGQGNKAETDDLHNWMKTKDSRIKHKIYEPYEMPNAYDNVSVGLVPTLYAEGTSLSCCPKGTIISTEFGVKDIENIKIGDMVLTHTGGHKKVTEIMSRNAEDLIEFSLCNFIGNKDNIKTTPNHPIYAIKSIKNKKGWADSPNKVKVNDEIKNFWENTSPKWMRADDLERGDVVVFPKIKHMIENNIIIDLKDYCDLKNTNYDDNYIWSKYSNRSSNVISTKEIAKKFNVYANRVYTLRQNKVKDCFVTDVDKKILNYLEENKNDNIVKVNRFIKIDSDLLRLFGFYIAEGNTSKSGIDIQFSFHQKEIDYHDDVLKLMKKYFNLNGYIRFAKKSLTAKVIFSSKIVSNLFNELFGVGAYNKKIPKFCFNISNDMMIGLLKGLFYGDGSYCKKTNKISYCTASLQLKEQIFLLLTKLDIYASTTRRIHNKNSITWQLCINGQKCIQLSKLLNLYEENPNRKRSSHNQYWSDENYFYLVINDIKKIKHNDKVYNFEVEDDHSYIANHITVHNCLELLASNVLPITTWVGGLSDLIQPNVNGIIIPPNNSYMLTSAIEYVMQNPDHVNEMRENGQRMVKHFGKDRWEEQITQVVKSVYGEP